jgi:hypothetical protein
MTTTMTVVVPAAAGGTPAQGSGDDPLENGTSSPRPKSNKEKKTRTATPAPAPKAETKTILVSNVEGQKKLRQALAEEADVRKALETAKTFAKAVRQAGTEKFLENVAVGIKQDPTAHIHIDPVPEFESIAKDSNRAIGDVDIPLRPYYGAHFSMAPALVYSLVRAATFTAEKQADGTLHIAESDAEYRGQNISAMLTITPRSWSDPTVGGGFQIGISPVKDQVGFFGGGQFRIADLVRLGAGYAYQQVPQLAKGLAVGDVVATAADIKTSAHFKGGLYLSIDIRLPNP